MDHLSNNVAMCLGCENAEPLPLEAEDAPKPLGVKPQGLTVENLQKMQQKQSFDPPRRAASVASTKFGGDPTDMTDEEIKEYLVKGVQRCSLPAMELVHGRSLQLPETRGMYVLASRAWVEEQQRKEQWAEAELYYEPTPAPVKKVKLKRKRHIKEETEEKKAEEAADPAAEPAASADATEATEPAEPALEAPPPPEPTQVSQDATSGTPGASRRNAPGRRGSTSSAGWGGRRDTDVTVHCR